ncbi:MAG: conjugal transfer protein [Mycobacteriaceae bacterium]|nr:conjugal transfer protein [Mycobacteriaceae bacterium]
MPAAINPTWRARLTRGGSAARRLVRLAVAALGAAAGLHLLWSVCFGAPTDVVGPARTVVNTAAVVSSFAQDYVSVWLTATSSDSLALAQFVTLPGGQLKLPPTPAVVIGSPTVVAVTFAGRAGRDGAAQVYSVVVGVTQRPYESAAPTRALYRVAVLWSGYGARAAGLPARIGGPGPGADGRTAYPVALGVKDPAFQVVSGFLTAYLTKSGNVDRYTTADSLLVGLGDAYQSVTLTALSVTAAPARVPGDGQRVRVLADVSALTSQYAPTQLAYPLTLTGVGGRWCVSAIDVAPAMSGQDDLVPVVAGATTGAG